ncbi:tRNA (carboxymethyluridine(34)-5-O)-methyltransferase isoform X1 [Cannabis sativa]|uniref:tRNA (carboxymethyluridine(34)-5-O)-methyltransferase isoform X1 n=2 Tax=Cannabis sativa TaxID=3483 RepID=UPI0011E01F15|nr:tRNA (carboxymethyluridine(34)-5-O)-methyltransferase isoform X1 [Cannabis sativa]
MFFDFIRARASKNFYLPVDNICLPITKFGKVYYLGFSGTMRDIKVKGTSNLCTTSTTVSDGESHVAQSELIMDKETSSLGVKQTPEIEKKFVHRVYDAIAPHFSSTRYAKWPKVAAFLSSLASGSLILDAGCGNGKYLGLNPDCFFIGCDISYPLIKICADRGSEVLVADAVNLPYRTGFGDAAISIAVLHHLSTESRRKKAIEELVRVVKKGGLVLITVWAAEQEDRSLLAKWTPLNQKYVAEWIGPGSPRDRNSPSPFKLKSIPETEERNLGKVKDSKEITSRSEDDSVASDDASNINNQEYFIPWHLPYHRAEVGGASACAVENGFAKKDDKKGAVVYNRYYHVFSEGELERLVVGMENAVVVDRFFDKSNWCIVLQKTS